MQEKYDVLDVFKVVAAIFVVGIHSWPLPDYNSNIVLFSSIGRFAVPLFLLSTGFLVQKKLTSIGNWESQKHYLFKYILRLLKFYFAWWLIYLWLIPLNWQGKISIQHSSVSKLFVEVLKKYFLNFFYGSTFLGSWYISATIIGVIFVFIVFRKINWVIQFAIGIVWLTLLLIVLLYGKHFLLIEKLLHHFNNFMPAESFLIAVPFIIFGKIIEKFENSLQKIPFRILIVAALLSIMLVVSEFHFWQLKGNSNSLENLLFSDMLAVVSLLVSINKVSKKILIPNSRYLRNISSFIYMGQFGIIVLTTILRNNSVLEISNWTKYSMVLLLLIIIFNVLYSIQNYKYCKFLKYFW